MICRSENQNIIATNCCRWTHEFQLCSLCSRSGSISWRFIEIVFLRVSPPRNCSSCPNLDKRRRNMRFPPGGQTFKRSLSRTFFPLGPKCLKITHFFSKNSTLISQKNCRFFLGEKLVKMLWFLDLLAVDNFDFTRKIVKKIEFLDKNLTFRIVCVIGKLDFRNNS